MLANNDFLLFTTKEIKPSKSIDIMKIKYFVASYLCLLFITSLTLHAQNIQKKTHLALTPPMGWNSWNTFRCDGLNEQLVKDIADIMASNGMKEAGYEYVNLDDCWQIGRDAQGVIIIDSARFPSGIKALADYVHSKGLKLGIYSDAGLQTCAKRPGGFAYEEIDAKTYSEWGVDYLKYDFCNLPLTLDQAPSNPQTTPLLKTAFKGPQNYTAEQIYFPMAKAISSQDKDIVLSICNWGVQEPWKWAGDISHLWRTTPDIRPYFKGVNLKYLYFMSIMKIVNRAHEDSLHLYAEPGRWNDPDMLEVGNGKLTYDENVAHFSMWAMMAAPLLAGNDLRNMKPEVLNILTNKKVIAVDQDALGKQGFKIKEINGVQVWLKPLSENRWAICFLNPIGTKTIQVNWAELNLGANFQAEDLWQNIVFSTAKATELKIPKHGVRMFLLK
jgi:alpha-galactosidase